MPPRRASSSRSAWLPWCGAAIAVAPASSRRWSSVHSVALSLSFLARVPGSASRRPHRRCACRARRCGRPTRPSPRSPVHRRPADPGLLVEVLLGHGALGVLGIAQDQAPIALNRAFSVCGDTVMLRPSRAPRRRCSCSAPRWGGERCVSTSASRLPCSAWWIGKCSGWIRLLAHRLAGKGSVPGRYARPAARTRTPDTWRRPDCGRPWCSG